VFEDNFDGNAIKEAIWNVATNITREGNNDVLYVPENIYVDDGILVIKAERDVRLSPACGGNCSFTAGWITSKGKWFRKFGRWEVRAKLAWADNVGTSSHIRLEPEDAQSSHEACYPLSDIDVARVNGGQGIAESGMQWMENSCNQTDIHKDSLGVFPGDGEDAADIGDDFHVWAVEWDQNSVTAFVDGIEIGSRTSKQVSIPDTLLFWAMGLTVRDGAELKSPVLMLVDYVRMYSKATFRPPRKRSLLESWSLVEPNES